MHKITFSFWSTVVLRSCKALLHSPSGFKVAGMAFVAQLKWKMPLCSVSSNCKNSLIGWNENGQPLVSLGRPRILWNVRAGSSEAGPVVVSGGSVAFGP